MGNPIYCNIHAYHASVGVVPSAISEGPCIVCALEAENRWLRDCEEIKLVAFLSRPDVHVGLGDRQDEYPVVVSHEDDHFEGRADNVISAARMAMHMERKYKAAKAKGGD